MKSNEQRVIEEIRLLFFIVHGFTCDIIKQITVYRDNTLIIFDEIQMCERALTSLKYFSEEAPEYHVMAAGSLLGVAVNREKYSFPVGKVQMLTMYPMDLEEVLWVVCQ